MIEILFYNLYFALIVKIQGITPLIPRGLPNTKYRAIEILHASKVFGVNKYSLTQPITLDMNVDVGKSFIMLEAIFTIQVRQKKEPKPVKAEAPNKSNIPVLEGVHFATA